MVVYLAMCGHIDDSEHIVGIYTTESKAYVELKKYVQQYLEDTGQAFDWKSVTSYTLNKTTVYDPLTL